jgi:crotonobetainyl-CoA:carnitine CoA-transferase CaiB-like acyl-CoA transferase
VSSRSESRPSELGASTGAPAPLSGLKVIDWTHVLAGPAATYQLALLGADVIRVERADGDDLIRSKGLDPMLASLGLGENFVAQGAGKRSLAIDARDARSQRALRALIARADVLVENFRPGKLAALGLDPASLIEQHPRLVVCSITGFGPHSQRRAYDHVVQASSGFMAANASADGRAQRVGFPVIDQAVGQQAAQAVLAALLRRERHGSGRTRGEWLQVSMQGAALGLLAPVLAGPLVSGVERPRSAATAFSGSPLSGTFDTADGALALVCNAADQAQALLQALRAAGADAGALAELGAAATAANVGEAQRGLSRLLAGRSAAAWVEHLNAHGVPAAVVCSAAEAARAAARQAPEAWPSVSLALPGGDRTVTVPGVGYASTERLTPTLEAPVRRGAHTREILTEAGLDEATITGMLDDGCAWQASA